MDTELDAVVSSLQSLDPTGERFAQVFRDTFDQLYDGQRTGRYRWDQLFKTEKTHFGTLIEINLQREFEFADGELLDYRIASVEVDCKYSFRDGGWMLPPESWDQLVLVATADDAAGLWSVGVVRVSEEARRTSVNRDGKTTLSPLGRERVRWLFRDVDMPPNVFLRLSREDLAALEAKPAGQQRLNELFRRAQNTRIHRSFVATAAQQWDYMKRVRYNGGARTLLQPEGILIFGGDYAAHRDLAYQFAVEVPRRGEFVSIRVAPARAGGDGVELDGRKWRVARPDDPITPAPMLPTTKRAELS